MRFMHMSSAPKGSIDNAAYVARIHACLDTNVAIFSALLLA
jgi:hypothetical protein